jgi:recombination protein RecA
VDFPIIYGKGISKLDILLDLAVNKDIIVKAGSWYSYLGNKIAQGAEKVKVFLTENVKIYNEVLVKVKEMLSQSEFDSPNTEQEDDEDTPIDE